MIKITLGIGFLKGGVGPLNLPLKVMDIELTTLIHVFMMLMK